ncbi:hypothetical protein DSM104299_05276 [Baekduia alba]|nr:hypothetical protein DSM104299_05276 [Baekduia alba]
MVTFHRSSSGKVYYEVVVRTTTALPRSASGTILAGARINGYGPDLDFSMSDHGGFVTAKSAKGTHCYQQSTLDIIDPPHGTLAHPKVGTIVHVSVIVKGRPSALKASARLSSSSSSSWAVRSLCR